MAKRGGSKSIQQVLLNYEINDRDKYISREFQDYGYRLAEDLDDLKHKALYIKLAKVEDRKLLETARRFVVDAESARSKGRLFMWKLKELKDEKKGVGEGEQK